MSDSNQNTNIAMLKLTGLKTWLGSEDKPVRAVDGIDLEIGRGETYALLGESGCGKSMTALSIMRLLPPSGRIVAGDVQLDGLSLLDLPEIEMRRERGGRIAMIFQEPMTSLNPVMKVGDQIAEAVRLHDPEASRDIQGRVVELLDSVGIPDPARRAGEYPHQLSGGMKQRVMIAIALAGKPELLIADEPTTALDVTIQAQVLDLLKDLQRRTGMSILLITHDLGIVAGVADKVAVMYAGQIVETAAVKDFFKQPAHPYSRKLFRSQPTEAKRDRPLDIIPGMVPPLDQEFTACRFASRCEVARDVCQQQPPWRGDEQQGYRCHLAIDEIKLKPVTTDVSAAQNAFDDNIGPLLSITDMKVHFPIKQGVLQRTVGHVKAVDGLSLDIKPGRTLALVGESGCGKTTVGKGLLQLIRPTDGSVRFNGHELTELKGSTLRKMRRAFQIIFQDPASSMNPRMLVGDIVAEGMEAQGIGGNRQARQQKVAELLQQVGLPANAATRYPHEFSGGQRQRICIARALAVKPQLVVCDEPTSALDVSVQAQVLNLLKDLQRDMQLSYLFITHNIAVVSYLAHEVAVMYLGRVVEQGTVEQVLDNPLHPYTQALLSAVPVPDPEHQREVLRLEGDMPSPAHPPSGCHFHPRCPKAMDACRVDYPAEVMFEDGRRVSCLLVEKPDQV